MVLVSLTSVYSITRAGTPVVEAAAPATLNFQARLLNSNGSLVPDGTYNIEFKLYNAVTSSGSSQGACTGDANCLWTETRTGANKVNVKNGYLSAYLGDVTSLPTTIWNQQLWLTMNIGGSGSPTWDGEMTPRIRLTSVPYAFRSTVAESAETLYKNTGSFAGTVDFGTMTADRKFLFPDTSLATTASPGTICVYNGATSNCPAATGSAYYIHNDTGLQTTANFNIQGVNDSGPGTDGTIVGILRGAAGGQTVDLLQFQATGGSVLAAVTATGNLQIASSLDVRSAGTLSIGTSTATAITLGKAGITTTNAGALTVTELGTFNGGLTSASNFTVTNAGNVAFQRNTTDFTAVGTQDDVNFGTGVLFRINGATAQTITSIAGGADGRVITIVNAGANAATIQNDSGGTATNRIITGTGGNLSVPAGATVDMVYDSGASRWRVIAGSAVAGGAANQQLSNLSGTIAINASLTPDADNTLDLGSSAFSWRSLYADTSVLSPLVDTGATLSLGTGTATAVSISRTGVTTTVNGALTAAELLTGNAGITTTGGAVSLTGNAASSLTTSAGALTLTSAAAATWSTSAGDLTIQAGSGTVSLGTSTSLTASGALAITSGGATAFSIDAGGAASLSVGATNANAVSISKTGVTTTVNGALTVTQAGLFNGGLTVASDLTVTNAGNVAFQRNTTDFTAVGTQDDVNLGTGVLFRINGASAQTITSIAGGADGRVITIVNAGANAAAFQNETGPTAANRIITGTGGNLSVPTGSTIQLAYDSGASRWRVIGGTAVAGGAANQQLSNLSGTIAINASLTPNADNTLDLGSSAFSWRSLYADTSVLSPLVDTGATLSLGTGTATAVSISRTGVTTTVNGALTATELLTGNAGITTTGGAVSLTGNAASSLTTSAGALTLTSAAAATWSTSAGDLTIQAGSGIVSLGTSTSLTASGTLAITSGGATAFSIDAGGAATLSVGATNANAVSISKTGVTTTVNGALTVTQAGLFNGGLTAASDFTVTNAGNVAFQRNTTDFTAVGTQDDVNFGTGALFRINGATAQTITSIAGGADGRVITLINAGANAATIQNDSGGTATNRIITGTGGNISIPTGASIELAYDSAATRWRVIGGSAASGGVGVNTVGTFTGASIANGASISGTTITFGAADDTTNPGLVSTGTQTFGGAKTFSSLIQGNAGITTTGGAVSLTGNAASSLTTSAGALTLTSAAAATWSTSAGDLTIQAGSGIVSLGSSTSLTATGALGLTSGGANALSVDAGGAAALNLGITNANAVSISRTGITTTVNGALTVTELGTFNGGLTAASNFTVTNAGNVAFQRNTTDYTAVGTQNNVNFGTGVLFRISSASALTITGIQGGADGRIITLVNASANVVTLNNNDTVNSTASNVIITGTGNTTLPIPAGATVQLAYDSSSSVWRVIGGTAVAGGAANQQLSNLSGTIAINASLTPDDDNTRDLGSSAFSWRSLYADTTVFTPSVDVAAAGTLSLGTGTNTSAVSISKSAATTTVNGSLVAAETLSVQGTSLFKPTTPSTTAVQIQNGTTSASLFTADTVNMKVTIAGGSNITFAKALGGTGTESGRYVTQTTGGGYAVTGTTTSYGGGSVDVLLSKYDANGSMIWSRTWGGAGDETAFSVEQTTDGGFIIGGQTTSYGAGSTDAFIAKYDTNGNLTWSRLLGAASADLYNRVRQTTDGGYIAGGTTASYGGGGNDGLIAKYDSAGTLSWAKTWGGASNDGVNDIIQTVDGGYATTGNTQSYGSGVSDVYIAKFDSAGTLSWSRTWGGTATDNGNAIVQAADGGFVLAARTLSYGNLDDAAIIKYDSSGTLLWSRTWGGGSADSGRSVTQTTDGNFVLAGFTASYGAGSDDAFMAKYDNSGTLSWSRTFGTASADSAFIASKTLDGGVALAGTTAGYGAGLDDIFLAKYDSLGAISGCSAPLCQTPTPSTSTPTPGTSSPSAGTTTPTPTTASQTAGTTSPTPTQTNIIAYAYQEALHLDGDGIFTGSLSVSGNISTGGSFILNEGADRFLQVQNRTTNAIGNNLTVSAGSAGNGSSAFNGGNLLLQGGAAGGTGNANGGSVTISGGAGVGTGTQGLVNLSTTAFTSSTVQTYTVAGVNNITAGLVDQYSTIPVLATTNTGIIVSVPDPAQNTVIGRVLYISARDASLDFTLRLNASGTPIDIAMKKNSTATLIWNGDEWTAAGASSSTDLQSAYNNTLTSAGGAELVLNAPGANADGFTIRNNATTAIVGGLLEVQTSIGSNLFSVNNNATEYAINGGAESATLTGWSAAPAGGTAAKYTTAGDNIATGTASVFSDNTSTAATGIKNTLSTTLTQNLKYKVSYTVRNVSSTVAFSTLDTVYSVDGTATTATCVAGKTSYYNVWTRIDCTFTATSVGASNAIIIRHSDAAEHDFYVDNFSVTVSADVNHAADGDADTAANIGAGTLNWGVVSGSTVTQTTSVLYNTSGAVSVSTAATAGRGVYNKLSNNIAPSTTPTTYRVAFYARGDGTNTATLGVAYTPDNGTSSISCQDYNTQVVAAAAYTLISCYFRTDATSISNAQIRITQTAGSATTFYVDNLIVALNSNTASNVQVGGANKGGPTTLLTLDRSSSAPIAANNDAYLGSMYYDTTTGRIQCYEADGWGACGSSPDVFITLTPEYTGAVLNGTGVGVMTADFCGNGGGLSVNTSFCGSNQTRQFYKWTSPQATEQTYSIFVSYKLPTTFKSFDSDTTVNLTALSDNVTNGTVTYEMFKSTGGAISRCSLGPDETTVTTTNNTWQTVNINGNETSCSFAGGNNIIFKINVKSKSDANVYVENLSFTYNNN